MKYEGNLCPNKKCVFTCESIKIELIKCSEQLNE